MVSPLLLGNSIFACRVNADSGICRELADYFDPWLTSVDISPSVTLSVHIVAFPLESVIAWEAEVEILGNENTASSIKGRRGYLPSGTSVIKVGEAIVVVSDPHARKLDVWGTRQSCFRTSKEIIQRQVFHQLMHDEMALLHSAAIATRNGIIGLVGPRKSGKTWTQLSLATNGYAMVSADRMFVGLRDSRPWAYGYPARCAIAAKAFRRYPKLGRFSDWPRDGQKALVPMPHIVRSLNTSLVPEGRLRALVFVDVHTKQPIFIEERVRFQFLEPFLFTERDPIVRSWLGIITPDLTRSERVLKQLISSPIPFIRSHPSRVARYIESLAE